ncbi:hybrid sensor histidine kinase/response regulator [Desulfoluna limicola]|uniref:histidine kinase n=1 Tax=Desulfoluna limicola TaxID=2810562 RepID=A0ABM7PIE9_9BACT|nr:hybrid sensor histidine kinase/response regulator [Desulfoluna limicola]BCS97353.1 hybrid sensor histidine kinase/response regulator [Desulfoluna limicola]
MSPTPYRMTVLIVDDMPTNIKILGETLRKDYDISFARSGTKALEMIAEHLPDLILLDIMMPGIDGYEVLRRIKENPDHSHIPVIFISARDDEKDETYGLEMGAVDYITKPFRPAVVRARVRTHMELKMHRDRLNSLVHDRTRQLIHSDRLATLGTLSAAVAHEVKNPLHYVVGNAEMIIDDILSGNMGSIQQSAVNIVKGAKRINALTDRLKGYSKKRGQSNALTPLNTIIDDALEMLRYRLLQCGIEVNTSGVDNDLKVSCDPHQISQVFINLINNSTDALCNGSGMIFIQASKNAEAARVTLTDNGPGIPTDKIDTIFEPFITEKSDDKGTGLGLFITRHILARHGGEIHLSRSDTSGSEFTFTLPLS